MQKSLAYAERVENILERLFGADGPAGDIAELTDAQAEVFGEEVAGKIYVKAVDDTADALPCPLQSLVMTGTRDNNIILTDFGDVSCSKD